MYAMAKCRGYVLDHKRKMGAAGAAIEVREAPAMGRRMCLAKCRGRGDRTGAEDKDSRAGTVRSDAGNRVGIEDTNRG